MELKRDTISAVECVIDVDTWGGFTVRAVEGDGPGRGQTLASAKTLEAAIETTKEVLAKRRVRVEVPYVDADGHRGIATGIHAGNGSVLAREGSVSVQLGSHKETKVFPGDVDPAVVESYLAAKQRKRDAEADISTAEREHMIDLREAVAEAAEKKLAEAEPAAV